MIGWIILAIVIILILLIIGIYNNLVKLKMKVKNAWAQIDTQLKRRFDLIPNLVETVKGYMTHEEKTLKEVVEARNKFVNASSINDKSNANNMLSETLKSVFALAEAYPELKANVNFASLQEQLTTTEDKIAYSRQFYNDTVQMYNTAIMSFPGNILANIFKFTEQSFFELTENTQRETPNVKF